MDAARLLMAAVVTVSAGALAACGGGNARGGVSAASCAGPLLTVTPTAVHPGDIVHASGKWFAADCYDTGQRGIPPALTGMTLRLRQGSSSWTVATKLDATGSDYAFAVRVRLPEALHAGTAQLVVAGYSTPVDVHVTAADSPTGPGLVRR